MGRAQRAMEVCVRAAREHRAALEALRAFGEAIATVARARLVARAMEGRNVRVSVGDVAFVADRWPDGWYVMRTFVGRYEDVATIHGTPEDTAAEVVDTLLRLAAEWSER